MVDHKKAEEIYKLTRSYVETGKYFGVSKQRIHEILSRSQDREVIAIRNTKRQKNLTPICFQCNRPFGGKVRYVGKGLCFACWAYNRRKDVSSRTRLQNVNYPKFCIICNEKTEKRRRCRGMCGKCYEREYVRLQPYFRKAQRKYYHKNLENLKIKKKEYYQRNKEKFKEYSKRYYLIRKNPYALDQL